MGDALKFTSDDGVVVLVETIDVPDHPLTARGRPEAAVDQGWPEPRAGGEAHFWIALRWGESRSR